MTFCVTALQRQLKSLGCVPNQRTRTKPCDPGAKEVAKQVSHSARSLSGCLRTDLSPRLALVIARLYSLACQPLSLPRARHWEYRHRFHSSTTLGRRPGIWPPS